MTLKPQERRAILAGKHPELVREGETFKKGEVIALKTQQSRMGPVPQVSITILGIKRGKKGEYLPEYSVRDDRDEFLRHGGGTTRDASQSVDPEASLVSKGFQKRLSEEGGHKTVRLGGKRRWAEDVITLLRDLEEAKAGDRGGRARKTEAKLRQAFKVK